MKDGMTLVNQKRTFSACYDSVADKYIYFLAEYAGHVYRIECGTNRIMTADNADADFYNRHIKK